MTLRDKPSLPLAQSHQQSACLSNFVFLDKRHHVTRRVWVWLLPSKLRFIQTSMCLMFLPYCSIVLNRLGITGHILFISFKWWTFRCFIWAIRSCVWTCFHSSWSRTGSASLYTKIFQNDSFPFSAAVNKALFSPHPRQHCILDLFSIPSLMGSDVWLRYKFIFPSD